MNDKYEYEIKDGCFNVVNTEKRTSTVLCNFTAKIVKEEHFVDAAGNTKIFYHVQGTTQKGELLKPIRLSIEEYDKGKWFRTGWGGKNELNDIDGQKNALKHLLRATVWLSNPIPSVTVYEQTGVAPNPLGQHKFLFGNGAITTEGIDLTSYSDLPAQLNYYQLPEQMPDDTETKEAIKAVFDLLNFSESNHYLGLVLCLAAIRATISMWLPIEQFIFLIGPKDTFERSIEEVIQSFFGVTSKKTPLVSWESNFTELEGYAHNAKNGVLVVDNFVYPTISKRRHDFTVKAEKFLQAVGNGLSKSSAKKQAPSTQSFF